MASARAAPSPATSDAPRCARTAAASHRHPRAVAVSRPSRRSALSSSTVWYGLPDVCASITPARPAAVAGATCSISATMVTEPETGRLSSR